MNYFVRLLLDPEAQVQKNVQMKLTEFPIYNAYPVPVKWIPLLNNNLAIFYNTEENKMDFLQTLDSFMDKNKNSVDLNYFIINDYLSNGDDVKYLNKFKNFSKFFNVRIYKWSLNQFFDDIIDFRNVIKERRIKKGHIEAFDRKITVIVFDLERVKDKDTFLKLFDVLKKSRMERIFPILLSKSAKSIPKQFHKLFDLAVYIGRDNQIVCDFVNANLGYGLYDIQQEHIGTAFIKGSQFLEPIHPWEYTQSEFGKEQQKELDKEYDDYLQFLSSLNG